MFMVGYCACLVGHWGLRDLALAYGCMQSNFTSTSATALPEVPWTADARVMALVGLAHAISHFSHLLLPPLFPIFMREFGLSFSEVGLLTSVYFVVSGVGQALSGFVVDRVGARPVLFAALALFFLSALLAGAVTGYPGLLLVAALAGLGNAPFHPVDFSILNQRVSPVRLGHAFSVHGLSGNLGWALAPVFLVGLAALLGWRTAYLCAAGLYVLVGGVFWWQREHLVTFPVRHGSGTPARADMAFLRLPVVWWSFVFFVLSTVTLAVVQTYAPSILQAVHRVSLGDATLTLTAYMLCGALGVLAGGFWAGGQRSAQVTVAVSMAAGAVLMGLAASGWLGAEVSMTLLAVTGFAVGVAGPSRDLMIRHASPAGATGRVYGTVYSGLDVGFALAPLVFGLLMDRQWYVATLMGAALTLLLSVWVALEVGRRVSTPR